MKIVFLPTVIMLFASQAAADDIRTLSLAEAQSELDAQNFVLAEARSRVDQARALVGQATSPLLPQVMAAGGYARNSDEAKVGLGGVFQALGAAPPAGIPATLFIQPLSAWTVSGSVKVPLLVPSAWADRAAAQRGAEAAEASLASLRMQVRAALAQTAWAAAAAEEIVAASERAVQTAEEHRQTTARMAEAGQMATLAVLNADTEAVRRQSDLVRARAELARTRLAMGVLLGRDTPVRVLPSAEKDAQALPSLESSVSQALSARPEIRANQAKTRASQSQTLSARLRLLPQISGSATVFASDMPYPTGKHEGWRLTLDATWLLFDGGLRAGKRAESEAQTEGANAAVNASRLAITQEVADARRDVEVAQERAHLAEKQCAFASEAAASAKRTFEAGVAGSLDVLDANDRLYKAEVGLADARGRLGMARAALAKALGQP